MANPGQGQGNKLKCDDDDNCFIKDTNEQWKYIMLGSANHDIKHDRVLGPLKGPRQTRILKT